MLFTAVISPTGGSAKLFTFKNLQLLVTPIILTEVERNLRVKMEDYHLERFFMLVANLKFINAVPTLKQLSQAKRVIVEKDAPVLASAKLTRANYLLTLDKKHFFKPKVRKFIKPVKITTPKELIISCSKIQEQD